MTEDEAKTKMHIHVIMEHKRPDIPDNSADTGKCPNCASETREGYGFAGGGLGAYTFCERCRLIVTKTEDPAP